MSIYNPTSVYAAPSEPLSWPAAPSSPATEITLPTTTKSEGQLLLEHVAELYAENRRLRKKLKRLKRKLKRAKRGESE